MSDFVENMCNHGLETIQTWRNTYQACWQKACEFDALPIDCKIALFSEDNPVLPFLDKAYQLWKSAEVDFANLGYVGLSVAESSIPKMPKKPKSRKTKAATR